MSGLHVVQLALAAGCAALASYDRQRPLAWYLSVAVGLDLLRLWLRQLMPPEPGIREGLALYLRHLDQAAYLGLIGALPAMAMALFLRRRPWPIGVVLAGALAWVAVAYPCFRGDDLMWFYTGLELAGALASVGFFLMWLGKRSAEGLTTAIMSGITLTSASLASVLLPQLVGPRTLAHWPVIVALHAISLGLVLVLQLRALMASPAATRPRS